MTNLELVLKNKVNKDGYYIYNNMYDCDKNEFTELILNQDCPHYYGLNDFSDDDNCTTMDNCIKCWNMEVKYV